MHSTTLYETTQTLCILGSGLSRPSTDSCTATRCCLSNISDSASHNHLDALFNQADGMKTVGSRRLLNRPVLVPTKNARPGIASPDNFMM